MCAVIGCDLDGNGNPGYFRSIIDKWLERLINDGRVGKRMDTEVKLAALTDRDGKNKEEETALYRKTLPDDLYKPLCRKSPSCHLHLF